MTVHPMIAALRKHKAGVFLIGLQIALTLAIVASVLAGLYPTFRASRVQPAWQLKSN